MSGPNIEIKLDNVNKLAAQAPIWALRGHAIQSYATLEQSLCILFAHCGNISSDVAGIIFFRITSTQVRNQILEKLLRRRFGDTYNLFWNGYLKLLRPVDIKRNEIVHWNMVRKVHVEDGNAAVSCSLTPPNFWVRDENTPELKEADLAEFMEKCDVFARSANMFVILTKGMIDGDGAQTWRDVFLQPLAYPLPDTHPLSRSYKEPGTQPPPSQP